MSDFESQRLRMVERQLAARGIGDDAVLRAMAEVPRELFVEPRDAALAYSDSPLPIGAGQTISQPFVVALMIEALELSPDDRVLEIGSGSGYAAAVLGRIAGEVYTVERHPELAATAARRCRELGYDNVHVHCGDGSRGWPEEAPFDAVVVAAGSPEIPPSLIAQLAPGGRLVIPVGHDRTIQELVRLKRRRDGTLHRESLGGVRFVPLVGAEGWTPTGSGRSP